MSSTRALAVALCLILAMLAFPAAAQQPGRDELAGEDALQVQGAEKRRATGKVVGGTEALSGEFPFAASIALTRSNGSLFSFCGGSLIAPEWVVTAAHCKVKVGQKVILGRHDLRTSEGVVHNVVESITHPAYNANTNDSDIALLRIDPPSSQKTIALIAPSGAFATPELGLTVVGWGLLAEGGQASPVLMKVTVDILANPICQLRYDSGGVSITDKMLCAGKAGQDSCQGDSGGPAFVQDTRADLKRLAGVVSFGIGCARPAFPGVYTRVSELLPWIEEHTGVKPPEEGCPGD